MLFKLSSRRLKQGLWTSDILRQEVPLTDSVLKILTEKRLPWCYCEMYSIVDKHIVLLGGESQWTNTAVKEVEVQYDCGAETLYMNNELLGTSRKHTIY